MNECTEAASESDQDKENQDDYDKDDSNASGDIPHPLLLKATKVNQKEIFRLLKAMLRLLQIYLIVRSKK